jgi:microcin C transport system substrate-binding protein
MKFIIIFIALICCGCGRVKEDFEAFDGTKERDAYWSYYNRQVMAQLEAESAEIEKQLQKEMAEEQRAELVQQKNNVKNRLINPEFFSFKTPADLPEGLNWQEGLGEPEIGSVNAKKGGVLREAISAFPVTLRIIGANSNQSFRSFHYDEVELGLVQMHPETGRPIPGLAKTWAVSADRRTVYFKLDEAATYSDGSPVKSFDFFMTFYLQMSKHANNVFGNEYYGTQFVNITSYGDQALSITLSNSKALPEYDASISPSHPGYYSEFGPDFEQRYQWRCRPTTGAYVIMPEKIVYGRSIVLSRVKNWWAKDRKYYRYRFNVDEYQLKLMGESEKVFQTFLNGEVDAVSLALPQYWYEKMEHPMVYKGYIKKVTFYALWPASEMGLWLNLADPLMSQKEVRLGLQHATHFDLVNQVDMRGDYERIRTFTQGYALFKDPPYQAREYSPKKAREYFAKAGFDRQGKDGVLENQRGERLSVMLTYRKSETSDRMYGRIKEAAKDCGLEYKLEGMEGSSSFQKISQKKHQAAHVAFSVSPPLPDHYQHFHSKDAYMEDGKTVRPNNNNLFSFADSKMDLICERQRAAKTVEEVQQTIDEADQLIYDSACWVPGLDTSYYRLGYWRWIEWPENFNVAVSENHYSAHVHWIDETIKKETMEAMRSGQSYPEIEEVYDQNLKRK